MKRRDNLPPGGDIGDPMSERIVTGGAISESLARRGYDVGIGARTTKEPEDYRHYGTMGPAADAEPMDWDEYLQESRGGGFLARPICSTER